VSRRTSRTALVLALPALLTTLLAPAARGTTAPVPGPLRGSVARPVLTGTPSNGVHTVIAPVDRSDRLLSGTVPASTTTAAGSLHPGIFRSSTALSTWQVTYTGFSAPAKAAFARAVATWSHTVRSSVPIVVDAKLTDFGATSDQLGGAGPHSFWGVQGQVAFPQALANARDGVDHFPADPDIDAEFAANSNLFYYGADPAGIRTAACTIPPDTTPTTGSCYDFESIVLHELGHGLGFLGTGTVTGGAGSYGLEDPSSATTTPLVYDLFTETADGTAILNYPKNSTQLATALTGNDLYWDGGNGASADRGRQPRLFAPSTWLEGSSYSHLSDASYPMGDADSLMTPYAEAGDAFRDPGEVMLGMFRDMGWVTPQLPGSKYTPVAPRRVLDTGSTKVGNGEVVDLPLGNHDPVPANATAVVLNVTAALPAGGSVVQAYAPPREPGAPLPTATALTTASGDQRANLVTVPLSLLGSATSPDSGVVRLRNTGGATRLVADLAGYYAPTGSTWFHTVAPSRLMDSRTGKGVRKGRIGQNGVVDLTVVGQLGVPTTASAVTLTLTAIKPTKGSHVSAYPTGEAKPTVSNLNLQAGAVAANQVVVKVGTGGKVRFYNYAGSIDLVADLAGWYDGSATGGTRFRPTLPAVVLDTAGRGAPVLTAGAQDYWDLAGDSSAYGVPAAATSAVVNVTGLGATVGGDYLTVFPYGTHRPTASNLNLAAGQSAASLATVQLGAGKLAVYNYAGSVRTHLDVQGYFAP
jgi:hypothetical protein